VEQRSLFPWSVLHGGIDGDMSPTDISSIARIEAAWTTYRPLKLLVGLGSSPACWVTRCVVLHVNLIRRMCREEQNICISTSALHELMILFVDMSTETLLTMLCYAMLLYCTVLFELQSTVTASQIQKERAHHVHLP
jgi:hypothetical protein